MADGNLAEADGGPVEYTDVPVFDLLENGLKKSANEPAVIVMHQPSHHLAGLVQVDAHHQQNGREAPQCLSWTFTELHRAACRLATGMKARGVTPGSTIVTLIPNRAEWFLLQWVSVLMKLTSVCVEPDAVQAARMLELESYMKLKPDVIIVVDRQGAVAVDRALQAIGSMKRPLCMQLNNETADGWRSFLEIGREGFRIPSDDEEIVAEAKQDDPRRVFQVVYTSGTSSGNPKGCPKTVKLTVSTLTARAGLDAPITRGIVNTAVFRAIAASITLAQWIQGGACIMPSESFDP